MVILGYDVGPLLKKTLSEVGKDNVGTLAASAAYNFFFSVFPLLLFLGPLISLLGDKQRMLGWLVTQMTSALPPNQVASVEQMMQSVVFASSAPTLLSLGIVLAAWSGSNIFGTLMGAMNVAYDVQERRSWIKRQLIRLAVFLAGMIIVVLSTAIFLDGGPIIAWLGRTVGLGSVAITAWQIVQYPIAALGLVALAFITLLLPDERQHLRQVFFVSVITAILWIAATLLFRLYIRLWPPNQAYGIVGAVIVLLTWMYYTMFIVLVGGELASEIHQGTGAVPNRGKDDRPPLNAQSAA